MKGSALRQFSNITLLKLYKLLASAFVINWTVFRKVVKRSAAKPWIDRGRQHVYVPKNMYMRARLATCLLNKIKGWIILNGKEIDIKVL